MHLLMQLKEIRFLYVLLAFFSFWILLQAILVSEETLWALKESKQWFISLIYLILGTLLSYRYSTIVVLRVVFASLMLHIVFIDMYALHHYLKTHQVLSLFGGLMPRDYASYITNTVWVFLFSEILIRAKKEGTLLGIGTFYLIATFMVVGVAAYIEGTRNVIIPIVVMLLLSFFLLQQKYFSHISVKKKIFGSIIVSGLVVVLLIVGLKDDRRFGQVLDTLPYAMDLKKYQTWKNPQKFPYPKLENNTSVERSNYLRMAWMYAGVSMVHAHPLGVGYGRNAFAHALKQHYTDIKVGHSHSGIIDLTIGLGIPGLLLWIIIFISLVLFSMKNIYYQQEKIFSTMLLFLIVDFFIRSLIDSNIRDHMLLMVMLLLGIVMVGIVRAKKIS